MTPSKPKQQDRIDEISADLAMRYLHKTYDTKGYTNHSVKTRRGIDKATKLVVKAAHAKDYKTSKERGWSTEETAPTFKQLRATLAEKTLTSAEKKKREEVAKAIERDNPNMPMAMKMAIATKTAKRVAEEELKEAKGLASMSLDQLKQEHDKVKSKIEAEGKSKMISMNHPLSQRARAIRLHMAIKAIKAHRGVNEAVELKNLDESVKTTNEAESDKLQGTPVVSLSDFTDKDYKKNKYGRTVPKKLKKDDPRVKFHKDQKQGVAEATGDEKFDKMLKGVTSKRAVAKQKKADTKQQARDAFNSMFGGGNPADSLGIRKKGVSEGTDEQNDPYRGVTPPQGKTAARNAYRLGKTYKNPHNPNYHKKDHAAWDRDYSSEMTRLKNKGVSEGTDDYFANQIAQKKAAQAAATAEFRKHGITARKHGGDDAHSWAVFINGRMMVNGLSSREVPYHKKEALKKAKEKQGVAEGSEESRLEELKASTLRSYINKTVDPVLGMPRSFKNLQQRLKGISRANEKLKTKIKTEEVEQVVEISKEKTQKYLDRATAEHGHLNMAKRNTSGEEQKEYERKENLRKKGISRVMNRLTKVSK